MSPEEAADFSHSVSRPPCVRRCLRHSLKKINIFKERGAAEALLAVAPAHRSAAPRAAQRCSWSRRGVGLPGLLLASGGVLGGSAAESGLRHAVHRVQFLQRDRATAARRHLRRSVARRRAGAIVSPTLHGASNEQYWPETPPRRPPLPRPPDAGATWLNAGASYGTTEFQQPAFRATLFLLELRLNVQFPKMRILRLLGYVNAGVFAPTTRIGSFSTSFDPAFPFLARFPRA